MFTHKLRYLFILVLGGYSYLSSVFLQTFEFYFITYKPWLIAAAMIAVCWLVWDGNRLIQTPLKAYILKQRDGMLSLLIPFLISLPIALAAGTAVYYTIGWFILKRGFVTSIVEIKLMLLYALRVNLFLQCLYAVNFYLERFQQKQLEAEELKRINTQARLQAITSQINPHFLFNNLNVLSTLVLQKNNEANTFIESFSAVYRYILANRNNEIVPLQAELTFIEPYLYLLQTRFGAALKVAVLVPDKYKEYYIVPVALQILVENAIKHNIVAIAQPLEVKIFIDAQEQLVVENNLQEKIEKPPSTGLGLQNINQRYKLLLGQQITVKKQEGLFVVRIPLLKAGAVHV